MFRLIEQSGGTEYEALRIAMAVRVDMALHAGDGWIVGGDRAVEIQPENFALIHGPVARGNLGCRRQVLRVIQVAVICEPVAPVISTRQVQLLIGSDDEPASAMIVV